MSFVRMIVWVRDELIVSSAEASEPRKIDRQIDAASSIARCF